MTCFGQTSYGVRKVAGRLKLFGYFFENWRL